VGIRHQNRHPIVASLNWLLRNHGGFARGGAGAIFVSMRWAAGMTLIVFKAVG